jgi:hypothetical protein
MVAVENIREALEKLPEFGAREQNYCFVVLNYSGEQLDNREDFFQAPDDKAAYEYVHKTYIMRDCVTPYEHVYRGRLYKKGTTATEMQYWDRRIGWTWLDIEKDSAGYIENRVAPAS